MDINPRHILEKEEATQQSIIHDYVEEVVMHADLERSSVV